MVATQPTSRLIGFVHFLRDTGFNIGVREILDVLTSLGSDALTDKKQTKNILRSLSCHSRLEWQQFDRLFDFYWLPAMDTGQPSNVDISDLPQLPSNKITGFSGSSHEAPDLIKDMSGNTAVGAGKQNTFSKADFRFLRNHKAMHEIERLAEQLALKLNRRLSYQYVIKPHGSKIDIRQTIRRNLSHGGQPLKLFYRNRRKKPIHLVILHDVSHSMTWNNPLLFRFARGLIRAFKTSEAFAFHTQLFNVTKFYREPSIEKMRRQLEERNHLWMGGTCIAESIHEFNTKHASTTLNSKTVLIIISDGFDTNEPEQLADELKFIKQTAKKIIWLNPMLGREGYNPNKGSMQLALPYIDKHAPAHSLDSLKKAVRYIADECR
ncbi:MAG: VWA domain-containing protein [Cycloclasticus sp.]|jgi:uncharacterized protein with von Willebrand factor type A (vWA) domain|nr:VWA domain-containing protein [Cycloclasticus sp.]HIL91312.1 VWA domain-containing protein [Cycloclasticus sp.]